MEATLKSAVKDSLQAGAKIIKGEFRLARGEVQENLRAVKVQSKSLVIAGVLGGVAALYALAFIFAGLGRLLGDNYWLSGLILFVALGAVAAVLAIPALKRLKTVNFHLTRTRNSIREQRDLLPTWAENAAHDINHKRTEKRLEEAFAPPPPPPAALMDGGRNEVDQGRALWSTAVQEFDLIFRKWMKNEKEVEKVISAGAKGVAYLLPIAVVGYVGFMIAGRRKTQNA